MSYSFACEAARDCLRNCFKSGSMSSDMRRARSPAALFPFSICNLAFCSNAVIFGSSCPINSFILISY